MLKPVAGQSPIIINIGTYNEENASAGSSPVEAGPGLAVTAFQAMFQNIPVKDEDLEYGAHGVINVGKMNFDNNTGPWRSVPTGMDKLSLPAIIVHELAHALGMNTLIVDENKNPTSSPANPKMNDTALYAWMVGLRDDNDKAAQVGQSIWCSVCENPDTDNVFDLRKDQGYFSGKNVTEVLAGALKGIPVKLMSDDETINTDYMSHSELKNSLLSHQSFRNYMAPMEAELAMLQDLGYNLDRRDYYGSSIYGDNQTIQNDNGYFKRNDAGTAYLSGEFNTATLGTGLHIYGSNNTVYQNADLLTSGEAGVGIRIDGGENTVIIPQKTKVIANGTNGYGILVAYGKEHRIIQQGTVEGDIGAAFDFGSNILGSESGLKGSYIDTTASQVPDELQGAAVESYDISGHLKGKQAAIFANWNSWVKQFNILNGATISGDIVSDYSQKDEDGNVRVTQINFGKAMNTDGSASDAPDENFSFTYNGNIRSQLDTSNIVLNFAAGTTSLNGSHLLLGAEILPDATLKGNSTYKVASGNALINSGTLAPGNSIGTITLEGDYKQTQTGTLLLETQAADYDSLVINGNAQLDGRLLLDVLPDYYQSNWQRTTSELLKVSGSVTNAFSSVSGQIASPTLTLTSRNTGSEDVFYLTRSAGAYSQYANNANSRAAGNALSNISNGATPPSGDMTSLLRALDFSATDGSDISRALPKLTPEVYSMAANNSLNREHQLSDMLLDTGKKVPAGEWRSFAVPFGGGFWQDSNAATVGYNASSYGILAGAEKGSERFDDWTFGFHGAVSGQKADAKSPYDATAKSTAVNAGLHARYAVDETEGLWLFGQTRLGVEDDRMDRRIYANGYSGRAHGKWTGLNASLNGTVGYRFKLNEMFSTGPFATLDYTLLHMPDVTESGDNALKVSGSNLNSVRSTLGVSGDYNQPLANGSALKTSLRLGWDKELADNGLSTDAHFTGYNNAGMRVDNSLGKRDAMKAALTADYSLNHDINMGVNVSSRLFRSDASSVEGNLYVRWRF
ncbi:autotransporter outer membrane beta-barrel domain-containing protein [Enterobacillus tribolii]|nr:autotransporter outer membrane beta-barrel domain-containing protein [Enterobacillus tribolii]